MFRITFTVEDRNLAKIMHQLAGQAYNLEVVPVAGSNPELMPVNGSARGKGGVPGPRTAQMLRADIVAAGGAPQMLIKVMRENKMTEINAAKVKDFCRKMGLSITSYSHLISSAIDLGLLKKAGKDPENGNGLLYKLVGDK